MIYLDLLFNKEGVHILFYSYLMKLTLSSEPHLPFSFQLLQLCCKDPFYQRNACFKRELQLASFPFVLTRKLLVYNDHWSMVFYFPFHIFTSKDGRRYSHLWNQPCPPRLIHFSFHITSLKMVGDILIFGTSLAFLIGFSICVAKIHFVKRLLTAKADINIFNQSLAICLVASGEYTFWAQAYVWLTWQKNLSLLWKHA